MSALLTRHLSEKSFCLLRVMLLMHVGLTELKFNLILCN